jgi:YfiH family protein
MLEFHREVPVPHWRAAGAEALMAFSTRLGGVSPVPYLSLNLGRSTDDAPANVEENRRRLLQALGVDARGLVTAGQVHGAAVAEVSRPGHMPDCDALWTRRAGLVLAVTAADCVPVLFHAPGVVAAAHAGWRGIAAGLPARVVETLATVGGDRAGIAVAVGPCIRRCCYVVGPEVLARFPDATSERRGDHLHLDLVAAVRDQLLAVGIAGSAIMDTSACTSCEPDRYFSHRRDAGLTGRHWGVVTMRAMAESADGRRKRAGV